jgi:hypothetical protein
MDAMLRRARHTGWGVGAEIKQTVKDYLDSPKPEEAEDEMHRLDLKRSVQTKTARKEWRQDVESDKAAPYPTSTVVVSFPRTTMRSLEARKYGRRGGTLAGEVRMALRAALNWKDDDD